MSKVKIHLVILKIDLEKKLTQVLLDNEDIPNMDFNKRFELGSLFSNYFDINWDWINVLLVDVFYENNEVNIYYTTLVPYQFAPIKGKWHNIYEDNEQNSSAIIKKSYEEILRKGILTNA